MGEKCKDCRHHQDGLQLQEPPAPAHAGAAAEAAIAEATKVAADAASAEAAKAAKATVEEAAETVAVETAVPVTGTKGASAQGRPPDMGEVVCAGGDLGLILLLLTRLLRTLLK